MEDNKKEIGGSIAEAENAENTQKELSDEQLDDVAGGKIESLYNRPKQIQTATHVV